MRPSAFCRTNRAIEGRAPLVLGRPQRHPIARRIRATVRQRGIDLEQVTPLHAPALDVWARSAPEVVDSLGVDPATGLSTHEVSQRRVRHGRNELLEVKPRSGWTILFAQFKSLLVALLAAAVVAALAFGEWVEAGAIGAVLGVNAALGFATELRAVRSMDALRKMGATTATVRRDHDLEIVPAHDLVPGDIVLVEGGDVVTADLRLLEASKLQANESTLTGESLPSGKSATPASPSASLSERSSMLFKGTIVTRGSGIAVVVATGMECELGKISRLVEEAKEETTPLERRLNRLGRGLVWVTLVLAAVVAASGYVAGQPPLLIIETAIALAVAAVPEGLPIIATIALARGMHRMARENALVNRLSAVETLGATSIICTDKTGTLTENKMSVESLLVAEGESGRHRALEIGVLCNNADLGDDDDHEVVGDPMEVALLAAGVQEGIVRRELIDRAPERREIAFDPDVMMMATIHGADAPYRVAVKGAPEEVVQVSSLTDGEKQDWLARSATLAQQGHRVLALAERMADDPAEDPYTSLNFVGLVGMFDPPRPEVSETIAACRRAGVRVVMVTGDHPVTAKNIARATGLVVGDDAQVVLGRELDGAGAADHARRARLLETDIFARVSPKQKLELIALHQSAGNIVAMTGDGVNDAPALRKADIGVAMGARGTAAAREAAAMVLKDDDLSTIAVAIAEGRTIFDNIRKFVVYLLSCNISEVLVVALAVVVRAPLPLLPLQILFLNLVTDVFPALALGVGEADKDVMTRSPRPASEPVIGGRHWRAIIGYGALITASVLAAFALALLYFEMEPLDAVTVSFMTLALAQTWHVFNMRRMQSPIANNEITRNPWIWGAVGLCVALLLAAVYIPPLARVLSVAPPGSEGWALVLGMSLLPLVAVQVFKSARNRWVGVRDLGSPAISSSLRPRRDGC